MTANTTTNTASLITPLSPSPPSPSPSPPGCCCCCCSHQSSKKRSTRQRTSNLAVILTMVGLLSKALVGNPCGCHAFRTTIPFAFTATNSHRLCWSSLSKRSTTTRTTTTLAASVSGSGGGGKNYNYNNNNNKGRRRRPRHARPPSGRRGNGRGRVVGGFSADDFFQSERSYVSFDGYEDDIERMAASYDPESEQREQEQEEEQQEEEQQLQKNGDQGEEHDDGYSDDDDTTVKSIRFDDDDDDDYNYNNSNKEKEEADAEPLSPLSLFSNFAEPTHLDEIHSTSYSTPNDPPLRTGNFFDDDDDEELEIPVNPIQQQHLRSPVAERKTSRPPGWVPQSQRPPPPPPRNKTPMPSRDEWRAKYAFIEEEVNTTTTTATPATTTTTTTTSTNSFVENSNTGNDGETNIISRPSPYATRAEDELSSLETTIPRLEQDIYRMNNHTKFNINSPKQVSMTLFGEPNQSTNKAVLEGMSASNVLAKLILEYRSATARYKKLVKRSQIPPSQRVRTVIPTTVSSPSSSSSSSANDNAEDDEVSAGMTQRSLLLIDTSNFIFRAYYSMPPLHRASDGMPVGAVLGFCNMLNRLVLNSMLETLDDDDDHNLPLIVLCKDASGPTHRNERYEDYKAHRPEAPIDLIPQFQLIRKAAHAYGLLQIEAKGYEADDVIATLSRWAAFEQNTKVDIMSGDKDLMQLITNETETSSMAATTNDGGGKIEMIDPMSMTKITHDIVLEKWGVPSHRLGDVLALAGDTADNIPGVPGIGPKIAAQLIQEYGDLESLLERTDEIKQPKRREKLETFAEQAILSQELVRLVTDIPWDRMQVLTQEDDYDTIKTTHMDNITSVEDLKMQPMNVDRLISFYDEMGFSTIKQRVLERVKRRQRRSTASTTGYKSTATTKKRKYYPRKKAGIPKPEDYKDVPF